MDWEVVYIASQKTVLWDGLSVMLNTLNWFFLLPWLIHLPLTLPIGLYHLIKQLAFSQGYAFLEARAKQRCLSYSISVSWLYLSIFYPPLLCVWSRGSISFDCWILTRSHQFYLLQFFCFPFLIKVLQYYISFRYIT